MMEMGLTVNMSGMTAFNNAQVYLRRLYASDEVLAGAVFADPALDVADLVELLAPEPLELRECERAKQAVKDRAVKMARVKLRREGKSFVVRDGVNPMVECVAPVVAGLNAPACAGLEAALRGLGADVMDGGRLMAEEEALQ